jgi:hypothetical protein
VETEVIFVEIWSTVQCTKVSKDPNVVTPGLVILRALRVRSQAIINIVTLSS